MSAAKLLIWSRLTFSFGGPSVKGRISFPLSTFSLSKSSTFWWFLFAGVSEVADEADEPPDGPADEAPDGAADDDGAAGEASVGSTSSRPYCSFTISLLDF